MNRRDFMKTILAAPIGAVGLNPPPAKGYVCMTSGKKLKPGDIVFYDISKNKYQKVPEKCCRKVEPEPPKRF